MIKIEHTCVTGWEAAIRGVRNPKDSHHRSDTDYRRSYSTDEDGNPILILRLNPDGFYVPDIGENDLQLMKTLAMAGDDHGKFLRFIHVSCDITAPVYINVELDTYKIGTVRNSCSFMYRGLSKPFELNDFSIEDNSNVNYWENVIGELNRLRNLYLETKDENIFFEIRQKLPQGYNVRYTWDANYQVLRNIYHARKNHRLPEWSGENGFCKWIESLPYAKELICSK